MQKPKVLGIYTDWSRWDGSESYGAVGWYRVINPLKKLGHEVIGKLSIGGPQQALDMKEKGDIWFFKPVDNEGMNALLDTAKTFTKSKIVLDIDDEPFDINPGHPKYDEIVEKSVRVKRMIEISDHLVVSTPQLKDSLKHFNKKITVIPNAIDPEIWKVKTKKRKDGKIRIGYIGSASHIADLPVINEALDEIVKKYPQVEIHFCGFVDKDSKITRQFHHKGTPDYASYPQFLADLDLDIALAPLIDSKFNRCKTPIKWLEHSMLKTPMVLSDIPPYEGVVKNYKTGYLAKNKGQWVKYLSWLIENEDKRKEIGEAAYKEVMENYLIEKQLPKYEKLFEELQQKDITIYTALSGDIDSLNESQHSAGAQFLAYTDKRSDTWDVREPYTKFSDDRRNSRIQKLMPHMFMDTEYSIYLDANIELLVEPQVLIDEFLKDKDIAVFRHIGRDCIYEEAKACVNLGKEDPLVLAEQVRKYAEKGHPEHGGLCECGVIIRRHTQRINDLNEKWWAHYCRYGKRDQISFPVVFPLEEVEQIEYSVHKHPYFKIISHK